MRRPGALLLSLLVLAGALAGCAAAPETPAALVEAPPAVAPAALALGAVERAPELDAVVADLRAALAGTGRVTVSAEPAYLLGLDPRDTGPRDVELELVPSAILDNATWLEIDGERHPLPWMEVYEGHLAGDAASPARLVLAEKWARGTVRIDGVTHRVRVNLDGNLPADAAWDAIEEESAQMRAYLTSPGWTFDLNGQEPRDCLSLVPTPLTPVVHRDGFQGEEVVLDLVIDSDAPFGAIFGVHTFPLLVSFVAEVDAIYQHQIGVRYRLVGLHAHTDPERLSDPMDVAPLGDLAEYWNNRTDLTRDLVHLVTGHPSNYAQANCIGGAGDPEVAYTFTTVHWEKENYGKHRHIQTLAHEIGHIMNAHHHYGNAVEAAIGTTIMHQGGEKVHPTFSTLSKSVIRGWAEEHVA